MKTTFSYLFLAVFIYSCGSEIAVEDISVDSIDTLIQDPVEIDMPAPAPIYTVEPFEKGENDWGYRIMNGDALFINQPHIPAAQGNSGFSSKEKAITAGNFMIYKLEAGIVPPTVSIAELDSLGVLG
ncbi:MAG: DUF4907 domain-containing protein [Crocinitomix sp.]|nr:DUF4907 domain-containing protein [Crocinitomix sp.]